MFNNQKTIFTFRQIVVYYIFIGTNDVPVKGAAVMAISISPLELMLDTENPRFVILQNREQSDIRKYLVTYEDVCQLAADINTYGSLLPGERIVALREAGKYVVIEGNRRTCSLQMLLNRDLIPDGFTHRIPHTSASILTNCNTIEIDVLPDRDSALELMTKRHIEGVKQWKPLAKKQFFAANYKDGQGQSVRDLSRITGVRESDIKEDIKDYKFFYSVYEKYSATHPDFNKEIVVLKTDPFWRIFKAKFEFPAGAKVSPKDFLGLSYDDTFNTTSSLPSDLFEQIAQLVFEKAIVEETVTTRNVLTDVDGIIPLLQAVVDFEKHTPEDDTDVPPPQDENDTRESPFNEGDEHPHGDPPVPTNEGEGHPHGDVPPPTDHGNTNPVGDNTGNATGGPRPGGPSPRTFFETISWYGKLDPANQQHQGLLYAINELYGLSNTNCGRHKAYELFPIASGMVLRTVYEQALRLRLMQVNLWGAYCQTRNGALPTLKTMEDFINVGTNKATVFPEQSMILIYDRVIAATHRDFLNANIHYPGNINVTPASLEAIAAGGMFALIQGIINMIN